MKKIPYYYWCCHCLHYGCFTLAEGQSIPSQPNNSCLISFPFLFQILYIYKIHPHKV